MSRRPNTRGFSPDFRRWLLAEVEAAGGDRDTFIRNTTGMSQEMLEKVRALPPIEITDADIAPPFSFNEEDYFDIIDRPKRAR